MVRQWLVVSGRQWLVVGCRRTESNKSNIFERWTFIHQKYSFTIELLFCGLINNNEAKVSRVHRLSEALPGLTERG